MEIVIWRSLFGDRYLEIAVWRSLLGDRKNFDVVNTGQTEYNIHLPDASAAQTSGIYFGRLRFFRRALGLFSVAPRPSDSCKTGIRGLIPRIGRSRQTRRALACLRRVIVPAPDFRPTSTRLYSNFRKRRRIPRLPWSMEMRRSPFQRRRLVLLAPRPHVL